MSKSKSVQIIDAATNTDHKAHQYTLPHTNEPDTDGDKQPAVVSRIDKLEHTLVNLVQGLCRDVSNSKQN